MAGSFGTARVSAQPGGHPHIAPLAPGVDLLTPVRKVSPFLNYPESEDLGFGSPALAVADLNGDGVDEVLVATTYSPIPALGGTVRAYLHVLKFAAPDRLDRVGNPVAIGDHADFHGYGACGIAVAEVPLPPPQPAIPKGIYVATLNGELTILRPDTSGQGSIDPIPVFRTVVEGSIGAFNSFQVANLDPGNPKPEVYLAGSSGIRRFDFQ